MSDNHLQNTEIDRELGLDPAGISPPRPGAVRGGRAPGELQTTPSADRSTTAAMDTRLTDGQRAVVLPFPKERCRMATGAATAAQNRIARIGQLVDGDFDVNAKWDLLITSMLQAWCWRDPSSIRVVEDCLAGLKASVERDWS